MENILYGKLKELLVYVFAQFKYNNHEKSLLQKKPHNIKLLTENIVRLTFCGNHNFFN